MIDQTPFIFSNEVMHQLLLDMAQQRTTSNLFEVVVSRLATFSHVALARIWVLRPGDICHSCPVKAECHDRSNCLHLVASAGQSNTEGVQWTNIHGKYRRFPLGARKVGHIAATSKPVVVEHINKDSQWILDVEWAQQEKIQGFAGQPLIFQGKVLGVLAVFTKINLTSDVLKVLRVIADHVAAALANTLAFEEIEILKQKLELENSYLREELFDVASMGGFVGNSYALQQVLNQVDAVAPTNASVLILGESGTGKELVAREIHHRSSRKDKPMIKVNCASIPRDLFESEFFGHAKGAFTGALADRNGRFSAADGGTLFLDELGDIPLEHQSKLLRVLQEGEYERVGENQTRKTDVRIIAATNKNLHEEIVAKKFREDLYFRLNVFPIRVPPLRERKEDIELLANYFLQKILQEMNITQQQFNMQQLQELKEYDWPGNVRELRNIVERSAIFSLSGPLRLHLPETADSSTHSHAITTEDSSVILSEKKMLELQRENTRAALAQCNWKIYGIDGAATLLGIKPTTLATRIKKMNLKRPVANNRADICD
ncbi:sigma-54-dependent Fis family transcriptional regulator [Desulfotalea psychrophila]|uniref:Related to hydrogenase-4 transcriptional activator n=1 Tax=Desulfotalea psychrophila (strain LSv54 / DSM 12343) TaxID=177439 RepID=Q6AKT3_DESPS|nr:sigma 54-interacting transcriptional regulator [Desulfotalea psychrophila]CAG37042.1 related to hydrogenase-4 transcriptional activator [Desulfotalea psychrophila LSv54]